MTITPNTRKEDDQLREALKNADLEKFKQVLKSTVFPKKTEKREAKKRDHVP